MKPSSLRTRAISALIFELGIAITVCPLMMAFRTRVNKSAIGSFTLMPTSGLAYQDDLVTPGIFPWRASSRKQMRQRPKRRRYPRGRPQMRQRLRTWTLNSRRCSRYSMHFEAILILPERHPKQLQQFGSLIIRPCRRDDGNFHTTNFIDFIVVDFREDDLLP